MLMTVFLFREINFLHEFWKDYLIDIPEDISVFAECPTMMQILSERKAKNIERLLAAGLRERFFEMDYSTQQIDSINEKLNLLDIGYELKQIKFSSDAVDIQDEFQIRLYDKKNGVHVKLSDVGVGVSQVLPIIVQSSISGNGILLIEQPELHLHPALQANLADVFIHSGGHVLIETHSEHLILRILRRKYLGPGANTLTFVSDTADSPRAGMLAGAEMAGNIVAGNSGRFQMAKGLSLAVAVSFRKIAVG